MKPLYEYANEYQKVIDLIENSDEITPELLDTLNSVSTDARDKIKNVAAYIKNLEALSKNIDDAINEMQLRQFKIEKKSESLKDYLRYNMEILQVKEVNTPQFDVKIRYNNYALHIEDNELLPREYFKERTSVSIDKQQIIQDLKNDILVPGASFKKKSTVNIK